MYECNDFCRLADVLYIYTFFAFAVGAVQSTYLLRALFSHSLHDYEYFFQVYGGSVARDRIVCMAGPLPTT